uniref:Uncharacterized protein n=1 Tax=Glossina austeni TaxID=7395 RepID=A0A1A9VRN4_GLOAU
MLSSSRSESEKVPLALCCDMYSALRASKSTVIPLACSFLACLSIALANFFLRLALQWEDNKIRVRRLTTGEVTIDFGDRKQPVNATVEELEQSCQRPARTCLCLWKSHKEFEDHL